MNLQELTAKEAELWKKVQEAERPYKQARAEWCDVQHQLEKLKLREAVMEELKREGVK